MAWLPEWGQSKAEPLADIEIGTSLGWYPNFPLCLSHPYRALPFPKLPFIYYRYWTTPAYIFSTTLVLTGNYSSYLNIHLPLSCAFFLSNVAVVIRPYSALHYPSFLYH